MSRPFVNVYPSNERGNIKAQMEDSNWERIEQTSHPDAVSETWRKVITHFGDEPTEVRYTVLVYTY